MAFTVKLGGIQPTPGNYTEIDETDGPTTKYIGNKIQQGTSTISQIARGSIQNTTIAISNAEIFHICDPKSEVALYLAKKSSDIAQAIAEARDAIITALFGDSTSPVFTQIKNLLKDAIALLKRVNKILKLINKAIQEARAFIADVNVLVNVIKTLPQRVAQTLQQCLALLQNALAKALTLGLGDVGVLIQETQNAISQTNQAVNGVKGLGQDLNATVANIKTLPSALSTGVSSAASTLTNSVQNFGSSLKNVQLNIANGTGTPFVQISNKGP
jgi:DNA repair ATPase RecN